MTTNNHQELISANAANAGRVIGAMFFSVFGGAWLAFWASHSFSSKELPLGVIVFTTLILLVICLFLYRRNRHALMLVKNDPRQVRARRLFRMVNLGQWIAIFIISNILVKTGLSDWIIPAVMLVIGLHFFPLAKFFSYRPHYMTGIAMVLLSLGYPFLATKGPNDAIGCLVAGLILWSSALWAITIAQTPITTR